MTIQQQVKLKTKFCQNFLFIIAKSEYSLYQKYIKKKCYNYVETLKKAQKQKKVLLELISSCEYHHLNEKEALGFINKFLHNRTICRRTYYNYKKQVYEEESEDKIFHRKLNRYASKSFRNVANILLGKDTLKKEYRNSLTDYTIFNEFSKDDRIPKYYKDMHTRSDTFIEKAQKFTGDLKSEKITSEYNYHLIPENATIRAEYVKCGNYNCNGCLHGPYFYGYWKDKKSGKLKKKYLGIRDPRQKDRKLLEIFENMAQTRQNQLKSEDFVF